MTNLSCAKSFGGQGPSYMESSLARSRGYGTVGCGTQQTHTLTKRAGSACLAKANNRSRTRLHQMVCQRLWHPAVLASSSLTVTPPQPRAASKRCVAGPFSPPGGAYARAAATPPLSGACSPNAALTPLPLASSAAAAGFQCEAENVLSQAGTRHFMIHGRSYRPSGQRTAAETNKQQRI